MKFDLKAKDRKLEVGQEVLVLLPDSSNKLLMGWKGPFKVTKKLNKVNYVIDYNGNEKTFHINLLKSYIRRADNFFKESVETSKALPINTLTVAHALVIDEEFTSSAGVVDVELDDQRRGAAAGFAFPRGCGDSVPCRPCR